MASSPKVVDIFKDGSHSGSTVDVFKNASNTNASHSIFNAFSGNQYNIGTSGAVSETTKAADLEKDLEKLKELPRVPAEYDRAKACLSGTRTEVIDEVTHWAKCSPENSPRIFWLHGMAGEGKSTIATTIACYLSGEHRLGASFFFSGDIDDRNRPDKVFSSIAFHLSHHHPLFRKALCEAIATKPDAGRSSVTNQFYNLLLQPFLKYKENMDPTRSVVIVLDALDECGTAKDRRDLLAALTRFSELPVSVKIFLSSRPEHDIKSTFDSMASSVQRHDLSSGHSKDKVRRDISKFVAERAKEVRVEYPWIRPDDWPGMERLRVLVDRASELFIWASTAMAFIQDSDVSDPNGQLEILFEDTSGRDVSESPSAVLDRLYLLVLNRAFTKKASRRSRDLFQRVVGAILTVRNPLPPSAFGRLLDLGDDPYGTVHEAVSKLRSVLALPDRQDELSEPLRTIHPSFTDFLTDKKRSRDFFIDRLRCHIEVFQGCRRLLESDLEYNAVQRVAFDYAAGHWFHHFHHILITHRLQKIPLDSDFLPSLTPFVEYLASQLRGLNPKPIYRHFLMDETVSINIASELDQLPCCPKSLAPIFLDISNRARRVGAILVDQPIGSNTVRLMTDQDIIVAVMGPTGTGKSSFISLATGYEGGVGHDLMSCTTKVTAVTCHHPDNSGRNVVLVDTPGFDDTNKTDSEILDMIAQWLKATFKYKIILAGLLYFHRISDNRMAGSPMKNLHMFRELCGAKALRNVILTTTMWDEVDEEMGSMRETELRTDYWRMMTQQGSRMARFHNTYGSAWEIINQFTGPRQRYALRLQEEMVDQEMDFAQTAAARFISPDRLGKSLSLSREIIREPIPKPNHPNAAVPQDTASPVKYLDEATHRKQKLKLWLVLLSFLKRASRRSTSGVSSE